MSDDIAIKVDNVSKTFKLPHEKESSLKSLIINFYKRKRTYEKQQVLKKISFEIKKGEFFGIVGRNGSGKSTLLKLLAGIYSPDTGIIQVNGKLTPFIELGVGFNPELTGRENVFLNGALLGFNRKEMTAMYDEIVDFAELEKFMDQKLKNYSSGMQVRLAFAIAIQAKTEILLLDEVLAVGDTAFQQKCYNYFEELKREKKTVVLVTHDMSAVKRFCTKALLLEKGRIKDIGLPDRVADQYLLDNITAQEEQAQKSETDDAKRTNKKLKQEIKRLEVTMISEKKLSFSDYLRFNVTYILTQELEVNLGYSINFNGFSVAEQNTKAVRLPSRAGVKHTISCEIPLENFNPGQYSLDVAIFRKRGFELVGYEIGATQFVIEGMDNLRGGPMKANGEWRLNDKTAD